MLYTENMRHYRKTQRAQSEQRTRERIVEATVELHGSVGPAKTTISEIAKRAGVQRLTVYRHFPSEKALFAACSGHYMAQNPLPDVAQLAALPDPAKRLKAALSALYAYFRRNQNMLALVLRDAATVPAMKPSMQAIERFFQGLHTLLTANRQGPREKTKHATALIALAISFHTWQELSKTGLSDEEAAKLMAQTVECVQGERGSRAMG
jgi:AcrR family transcriptional regulator